MDTVDKKIDDMLGCGVSQVVWCDHVSAKGDFLKAHVPTILIESCPTIMVVEEGKVKLLCWACLEVSLKLRAKEFVSH